ncbi:MAG TPA: glycosyltransferase family 9 protein [Chitinophaga sp.]|uniref:glycosyltransferase family 9 protein n=1 Tax=Chitinophaga sp. TaxID=1869181 RepID=UPI002DBCEA8F|nr:glycosyltransferase family 9 protein [Chitinophaga sp.]HEU4553161.1 glycosyltransferase family 9 protein [Chitinophaga sp.]
MQQTILAIRFSALGDVAMTIPVIRQVLAANPAVDIVLVSNKNWGALCKDIPRLTFFPADLKGRHKGVRGLYRLYRELRSRYTIAAVADLHQVLRSKIVRTFFRLNGTRVAVMDKGRAAKKALTRQQDKIVQPLTATVERYAMVFRQLGLQCDLSSAQVKSAPLPLHSSITAITGLPGEAGWIGLAPFATYREKTYPLQKMEQVLALLSQWPQYKILLFGGGPAETALLAELADRHPNTVMIAGRFTLEEELAIISHLQLMISMDSANMHLASLFGVPVVSVWGATHPYAGFMGFGQTMDRVVQITDLECRPCSVFGNKPCFRGDHACMEWITPEKVAEKVAAVLQKTV